MNKKILIIDDNISICEMYKEIFINEWYNVQIEHDGIKWITTAIEFNPDLVILDIMMPQINWFEVLETLKMHSTLDTIVFINSNLSGIDNEKKALNLWAQKYLKKSDYMPSEILLEVKKVFNIPNINDKKKIMVIDDNLEICEMYKIVLEANWYEVNIEHNWLNGLSSAINFKPDLIILDIMMSWISGFEVLESIKEHSDLDTIIIINSNLSSLLDEKKSLDLWARKFLRKSDYTPIQVADVIKNILI